MNAAIAIGTALFVSGTVALAQQDQPYFHAGWKMLGAKAVMEQRHAQDQAQQLYYYNQIPKTVPKSKDDAKALVVGIKKGLSEADKALDKLKAEPEVAKNKDAVALIDSIKKHHAKSHEVCGMAEEACAKHHPDTGEDPVVGDCCSDMWHEIDAAKADTMKLLKLLKIDKLDPPPKKGAAPAAVKK
jgi:hypothetical protein